MVADRAPRALAKMIGDEAAQTALADALHTHRPDDAVLSEEAPDDLARLDADRVWIIDPLDGTSEFAEAGRSDWAVHVALWQRATRQRSTAGERVGEITHAAVALPALDEVLRSDQPRPLPARQGRIRFAVSRGHSSPFVLAVARALGAELVRMGSAGRKTAAVLRGEADAYVHAGGQFEWDSAAPVGVACGWGAYTSRIDGSALVYNRPDPWLPDLVVCRPEFSTKIIGVVQELSGAAR